MSFRLVGSHNLTYTIRAILLKFFDKVIKCATKVAIKFEKVARASTLRL